MKRSYDLVAGMYDNLAKLFIGQSLRKAQIHCLHFIPSTATVLIAGGGTGWILEEIAQIHQKGLRIDYVDISEKMISLAQQRNYGDNEVNFIHQSIIHLVNNTEYNVIITPFFFDNFTEETTRSVFALLHQKLKPNGTWLYTDFQIINKSSHWQKTALFVMYSFFRIVCRIEAKKLPDVASQFASHQYQLTESKTFLRQFIITSAYKKL